MTGDNSASKSTAQKILDRNESRKAEEAKIIENQLEYKKALNDMAASPSGKLVLKTFVKSYGVFVPKKGIDGIALIEANTLRNHYLEFIRPYLTPENRIEIEN